MSNNATISVYKARWVVEEYEQQDENDYAKIFSPMAKLCSTRYYLP